MDQTWECLKEHVLDCSPSVMLGFKPLMKATFKKLHKHCLIEDMEPSKASGSKASGSKASGSKASGSKASDSKASGSKASGSKGTKKGSKASGSGSDGSSGTNLTS